MSQPELLYVEQPALDQLQSNGWSYKDGRELAPDTSDIRSSLKDVILTPNLEQAIKRINPWISDENLRKIIREIIEVKPKKHLSPPKEPKRKTKRYLGEVNTYIINQAKFKAAEEFCKDRKLGFRILTEEHLVPKK